eukprot:1801638-Pyramimonas_sp.AAC.1
MSSSSRRRRADRGRRWQQKGRIDKNTPEKWERWAFPAQSACCLKSPRSCGRRPCADGIPKPVNYES